MSVLLRLLEVFRPWRKSEFQFFHRFLSPGFPVLSFPHVSTGSFPGSIDSLRCCRIDGYEKLGAGGFEQALVGANKSQRFWAYRCSYQQATSKLNGVVGPERITINHLRRNIEDDISYRLPKEPSFCVLLQTVEDQRRAF